MNQVYTSNTSAVEAIAHIVEMAQRGIVKVLCTHYNTKLSNAHTKLQAVTTTVSFLVPCLSFSQAATHKQMMEKTDANLRKKNTQLAAKTEKPAHQLSSPQDKNAHTDTKHTKNFHK